MGQSVPPTLTVVVNVRSPKADPVTVSRVVPEGPVTARGGEKPVIVGGVKVIE